MSRTISSQNLLMNTNPKFIEVTFERPLGHPWGEDTSSCMLDLVISVLSLSLLYEEIRGLIYFRVLAHHDLNFHLHLCPGQYYVVPKTEWIAKTAILMHINVNWIEDGF